MLQESLTAKSFVDGNFELSAHLVVAKVVKKKDAILVNLPREKNQDLKVNGKFPSVDRYDVNQF